MKSFNCFHDIRFYLRQTCETMHLWIRLEHHLFCIHQYKIGENFLLFLEQHRRIVQILFYQLPWLKEWNFIYGLFLFMEKCLGKWLKILRLFLSLYQKIQLGLEMQYFYQSFLFQIWILLIKTNANEISNFEWIIWTLILLFEITFFRISFKVGFCLNVWKIKSICLKYNFKGF